MSEAVDDISAVDTARLMAGAPASAAPSCARPEERRTCFHCGESCPDSSFARNEKAFCCHGCQVVHELLTENGLDHFYNLTAAPGVRVGRRTRREQWAYLDEPALQQRLLDFTDGRTSRITLQIPAIHCVACVWLLENLFRLNSAIGDSRVNFNRREVSLAFSTPQIRLSEVVALLASIGYEPALTLGGLDRRADGTNSRRRWLQVGISGFAFGNIMLFSLPQYLGLDSLNGARFERIFGYLSLALALPVVTYSALDYWKATWLAVRRQILTLDVPIALGLIALYAQSGFEILSGHGEGYLDSLTGLIFFLLCGRAFQQITHERLAFDLDYKSFFPLSVIRKSAASEGETALPVEEPVSLSEVQPGDRILIRNGELIPADAVLVSDAALIDYSFVTGESVPVRRERGDYLYAGGQQMGVEIEVETAKAVSQSYLTSLWNHETFQKHRDHDLNSLTNRYSRRFTRIVLALAIGAALFWVASGDANRGLKAFTSVLIVACPCALALAAPFTLGTAQRLLARLGVFVKNALVLERLARVDAIVFDKTGTLTSGGRSRVSFGPAPSTAALSNEERHAIGALARQSTHPLSQRISGFLADDSRREGVSEFREVPGSGLEGVVSGRRVAIGSGSWIESRLNGSPPHWRDQANDGVAASDEAGAEAVGSVVHVSVDGVHRGAFVISNVLRPDTGRLLAALARQYDLALLSGDNERERERFADLFGGNAQLRFDQSPLEKLEFIRDLQKAGRTVMMVGDGLNDAGALKQSDVGVAVVEKVGAFSPASDLIIQASQVPRMADLLRFARRVTGIVKAGFVISAAYNVIGVSIAACGILSPLICAVLMPLSSASVVLFACGMAAWAARRALPAAAGSALLELSSSEPSDFCVLPLKLTPPIR